jgi:hypothetical protein
VIPPFLERFWGLRFELEITHEVFKPSPKFLLKPGSESGDQEA